MATAESVSPAVDLAAVNASLASASAEDRIAWAASQFGGALVLSSSFGAQAAVMLSLVSGVLGIAVADTLYFRALNTLGAARMGVMGNLYSPFVIVLSFLFLSERLTALQGVGFVLVSAGVLLVSRQHT